MEQNLDEIMGVGPFTQLLTMRDMSDSGPISDDSLDILEQGALVLKNDKILEIGSYKSLRRKYHKENWTEIIEPSVCLPGLIDVHTHICWAGNRSSDYSSRISGKNYLEIAKEGGGINVSVNSTRKASYEKLAKKLAVRAQRHFFEGVTTCEVKSGYGLDRNSELKILNVINDQNKKLAIDLIPTVLSAHINPKDFKGSNFEYLDFVIEEILTEVKKHKLSNRVDIFIDEGAFTLTEGKYYLEKVKEMGFDITVHADQFTPGSSALATEFKALSADHLENISERDIIKLSHSDTAAVVLPGCSLGLGIKFAPARRLLDEGASLVISTDWNPGSAPMGDLLLCASLISASEKLSNAETFASITYRAAKALNLGDRGKLDVGKIADFILFPTSNYKNILYNQGKLKPRSIWKKGIEINKDNFDI